MDWFFISTPLLWGQFKRFQFCTISYDYSLIIQWLFWHWYLTVKSQYFGESIGPTWPLLEIWPWGKQELLAAQPQLSQQRGLESSKLNETLQYSYLVSLNEFIIAFLRDSYFFKVLDQGQTAQYSIPISVEQYELLEHFVVLLISTFVGFSPFSHLALNNFLFV